MSYSVTQLPLLSLNTVSAAENLALYDSVDEDVLTSYNEFALASLVYFGMKEGAASEQSARMTAMDGASKNAGMAPIRKNSCFQHNYYHSYYVKL